MHRVAVQNEDSRFKHAAANFLLQRYRSVRQSPVQNVSAGNGPRWRFRVKQAAAKFLLPMHKYGRLTLDPFPYLISLFADTGTDVNAEKN